MTLRRTVPPRHAHAQAIPGPLALGAVAWLLAYATWASIATPYDATWKYVIDESMMLPLRAVVALLAFTLSRVPGLPASTAAGWRLFAVAFALGALSNVLRIAFGAAEPLVPSLRLVLAVPQAVCLLVGLGKLAWVREQPGHTEDWLDAGVIVLSGFLLASYFIAGGNPFAATHLGARRALFLLFLLVDVTAVWLTATAWFRRPTGVARHALGLLTLGLAMACAVGLLYDRAVQRGTFVAGGMIDIAAAIAFVLMILGLDFQRQQRTVVPTERRALRQGRHIVAPIAIIAASLPLLWVAWTDGRATSLPFLVTGITALLVLVIVRQHVARRQAVQAARERADADARFRSLVQRSSDAIFQVATDHRIQWASPSAGELTGSIPSLLVGRRIAELAHPEDRDRLTVFLANAGEPFARNAVLRWRLGRAESWHEVESVVSDLSADTAVGGLVLNTRDVSERVRLEQQLRQAQKLEAVGRLAGGIAHDFNNILAAIITHAQLVRDELGSSHESAPDLLEIEQTAQRGAVLTRRLLSFSRPEAGELRAQSLRALVRGMEPMLRRLLVSQVELWLDVAEDELWVRTADGQVEQILMNLAINARDAMPEGGVVHVKTRALLVKPGDRTATRGIHTGSWAELTVRDEGIGMDDATLARLFEPFFTTKPAGLGTGLGLATVRGIVRALGGHVTAESEPGKGTTMRVLLPLATAAAPATPVSEPEPPSPAIGKPIVLVVDDETTLRRAMERYLARNGYEVLGAPSALDALAMLEARAWAVDLIVTDMVMPRMGGREFVRRVRAKAPQVPVLCISGHMVWEAEDAEEPDAPWSREKLLAKPFPFGEFLARVREALGGPAVPV